MTTLSLIIPDEVFKKILVVVEARRAEHFKRGRVLTQAQQREAKKAFNEGGQRRLDAYLSATLRQSDHLVSQSAIIRDLISLGLDAYEKSTILKNHSRPRKEAPEQERA